MQIKSIHYYVFVICISFCCLLVKAQDQGIADSLKIVYQSDTLRGTDKMELLANSRPKKRSRQHLLRYFIAIHELDGSVRPMFRIFLWVS